jgi:hypothetical protein
MVDLANYIRLLEKENKGLRAEVVLLRYAAHKAGPVAPPTQTTSRASSHVGPTPYHKLLQPFYPSIISMPSHQREKVEAAVRGFVSAHVEVVPEVCGRPAIPKVLEKPFMSWFAAQKQLVSMGPSTPAVIAWTDLVRKRLPGIPLAGIHSTFTKSFCAQRGLEGFKVRALSGQITQAIPSEYVATYLEMFLARHGDGHEDAPASDEAGSSMGNPSPVPSSSACSILSSPDGALSPAGDGEVQGITSSSRMNVTE